MPSRCTGLITIPKFPNRGSDSIRIASASHKKTKRKEQKKSFGHAYIVSNIGLKHPLLIWAPQISIPLPI